MLTDVERNLRALIITALPVETAAVTAHLTSSSECKTPNGGSCWRGNFEKDWEVLVHETGPGNVDAALGSADTLNFFAPHVILMVGIAGGRKDVVIGDVVVATKIYHYESGKDMETYQPRPGVENSAYALVQEARNLVQQNLWRKRCQIDIDADPKLLIAPIASGEKVVADTASTTALMLDSAMTDAVAVEMEGFGVLRAAHRNPEVWATVVRGISDLLNEKREADATGSQEFAAATASSVAYELLSQIAKGTFINFQRPAELTIPPGPNKDADVAKLTKTVMEFIRCGKIDSAIRGIALLESIGVPNSREAAFAAFYRGEIARSEVHREDAIEAYTECRILARTLGDTVLEARAIGGLADLDRLRRRAPEATAKYKKAIALLNEKEHATELGSLYFGLAELANVRQEYKEATGLYDTANRLYESAQNKLGLANVKRGRGDIANKCGKKADAERFFTEALSDYKSLGNLLGEATAARSLAEFRRNSGDSKAAETHYEQAVMLYSLLNNNLGAANAKVGIGDLRTQQGQYQDAEQAFLDARRLARERGGGSAEANALSGLIQLQIATDSLPLDAERIEQALSRYEQFEDRMSEVNLRVSIARASLMEGRLDDAYDEFGNAREIATNCEYPMGEGNAESGLGDVALQRGDPEAAKYHFDSALRLAVKLGSSLGEANARLGRGAALKNQRETSAANAEFEEGIRALAGVDAPSVEAQLLLMSAICYELTDRAVARERAIRAEALFASIGDKKRRAESRRYLDHLAQYEQS